MELSRHHATTVNIEGESHLLKEERKAGLLGKARPATTETEEETATETAEPETINRRSGGISN